MLPHDTRTDERLVTLTRAGSDAAFEAIVARHRPALLGFATKLLGDHADAEDVVQDALIRALPALRAGDRAMAVRPWLYMIVRNRAFDHLRARRPVGGDEHLALVAAPDHADPAAGAAAREELDRLVADIAALPERQRLALVRRELAGVTHRELAGELGTSVGATKSLLVRARATLVEARAA